MKKLLIAITSALMVFSSTSVFAQDVQVSQELIEKITVDNEIDFSKAVLTTPTGEEIIIDNFDSTFLGIDADTFDELTQETNNPIMARASNGVYMTTNSTTPLFTTNTDNILRYNDQYKLYQNYYYTTSFTFLTVSAAQQNSIYTQLKNEGYNFVAWCNTIGFQVSATNPMTLTYTVGDGEQQSQSISNGYYTLTYYTAQGGNAIVKGYLTYFNQNLLTSAFNTGINFQ